MEHNSPYVLNSGAINELNDIITTFVSLKVSSAAVLAWSVILQRLKDITAVTRESREIRQSLRAVDRYGTAEPSDTDGAERTSKRSAMSPQRRSSTGSDTSQQSTLIEELHDTVLVAAATVDPVTSLATSALDEGKFFDTIIDIVTEYCSPFGFEYGGKPSQRMRKILIDLIRTCVGFFEYHPALFLATLELLTGSERYWDTVDRPAEFGKFGPDAEFFHDDELKHKFWTSALYRFPYETLPFLQLCKALTFHIDGSDLNESAIWSKLEEVDTFTCRLPIHFEAYKPVHMQEEDDYIQLTASLSLAIGTEVGRSADQPFADSKMYSALRMFKEPSGLYTIPSSTEGKIISTSKPFVVTWNHPYSILAYIGQVLQCASAVEDSSTTDSNNTIPMETVGEIIGLISAMLSSAARRETTEYNTSSRLECAESILRSTSDGLDRNRDIISTVLEIFEKELYRHRKISEDLGSMDVLVQCIQFAHALIPFKPDRIWPFLGRSGLLGIDKKESQLSAVVATQEMLLGRYDFLLGCIRLFDALVEDAVTHAVSRNAPTKTITRFGDAVSLGTGVSRIAIEKVLESFTRTMIEVFECTMNWRFVEKGERLEINYRLSMIFQKILDYCFAVNDNPNISQKLTSALAPAAEYIVSVFLSGSNNDVTVLPLLHTFGEGIETPITTLPTRGLRYWTLQVRSALKLTSTLIRVNNLVRQPPSHLEAQMFKAAPILAKVYAAHESYKLPVVDLFDSLVRSAAANNQQSPSLLGHLGQETASNFLEVLSVLDQPLNDDDLSSSIWRLLSAVISKRQQWFAIFVLTGSTPRDSFRNKTESASLVSQHPDPILNRALDSLSQITKLEPKKALSMLEFVALAADFWPWVLSAMASHGRFLMAISKFGAHVGSRTATTPGKPHKTSADFFNLKMASYVADILAMYTNYRLQLNDLNFAKALVPHLAYLIKNAILAPSYNNSLHTNLRKNFEAKFSGLSLLDFKRTALNRSQLGGSFFYDLELANKLLAYNPAWEGKKGRGFAEEVQRANLDLSVVDSQVVSWDIILKLATVNLVCYRIYSTAGKCCFWS